MSRRTTTLTLLLVAVALVAVACSSDAEETTTTAAATTTEATSAPETTSTAEPSTTTTAADTTTSEAPGEPMATTFAISEVVFGSAGYIEITNISDAEASLDGYWVCQQPSYHQLSGTLQPGESIQFAAADSRFGSLNADRGAMGLYTSADFGSPDAIVGYVAWGPSGHGRLQVAINAGVWTDGSTVEATGAALISTIEPAPISADGWTTG